MDLDLSAYLGAFLDEVDEQIQILEEEVLNLEQDGSNMDTIQRIFRAAHTLKGSSAAMGMEKMKELTHKIENVFDAIRNQELQVNTTIINIIFESIDKIKELKEATINGNLDEVDISNLITKLDSFKEGKTTTEQLMQQTNSPQSTVTTENIAFPQVTFDEYQKNAIKQAFDLGMNAIVVYVSLNDDALLKSVRAFLIYNNLKEIGEIIASFPSTDTIENEKLFDGHLAYTVLTYEKQEEVEKIVNSISDIKKIQLVSLTNEKLNSFSTEQPIQNMEQKRPLSNSKSEENEKQNQQPKVQIQKTIRIDVKRLDNLMNLVGELVISQTRLLDVRRRLEDRYTGDLDIENLQEVSNQLGRIISELQEGMMKTRMLPIEQLFNRFPRMVRDLAQKAEKDIQFIIEGKETELDRNLIEAIADPIIHLLRNAIDHGIETPDEREKIGKPRQGRILLKAAHEENHIVITIRDDGKGIDTEKIKQKAIEKNLLTPEEAEQIPEKELVFFIFKSGLSTAKKVTDISGRGVGMDIVRSQIEKLNGIIDIDSTFGKGTTFTIKLPLTLAIIKALLVEIGNKQFAVPLANVQEIIRLGKDEIKTIQNQEVGIVRDRVLPLVRLHERLNVKENNLANKKRLFVVILGLAERRVGIIIDKTLGNQEIVIKSLGKYIGTPKYISGATIMGDGKVALILDVATIINEEGVKDHRKLLEVHEVVSDENTLQLATFLLGNEEYGIPIDDVKDIITVPTINPVINSPFSILGMMNLRGKLIPVMDLRERFNIVQKERTRKSRIMVVEIMNEPLGLLVDHVTQVLKINERNLESAANYKGQLDKEYIQGICHLNDRLITVLNVQKVIDIKKLMEINKVTQI